MDNSALVAVFGTIGVSLLLIAFFLNVFGKTAQDSRPYLLMNFVGAGLSGLYALILDAFPLVFLEGVWAAVAAQRLAIVVMKPDRS